VAEFHAENNLAAFLVSKLVSFDLKVLLSISVPGINSDSLRSEFF
jgi:hypothetical protein